MAIAKRGVRNFLIHAGILEGELEKAPSRRLDMPDGRCFVTAQSSGLVETCADLGDAVSAGMTVARIFDIEHTGRPPISHEAAMDGILIGRRAQGLAVAGDMLAVVAAAPG